jgi:hypothetical protein
MLGLNGPGCFSQTQLHEAVCTEVIDLRELVYASKENSVQQ